MSRLCECGCGRETKLASRSNPRLGHKLGAPLRFLYGHGPKKKGVRNMRRGDPMVSADTSVAYLPLTQGLHAAIDAEDYERLRPFNWTAVRKKDRVYAKRTEAQGGILYDCYLHHAVLNLDSGILIDHRSGDGLDNRKRNLRKANKSLNAANSKLREDNSSGYRGVTWSKQKRRWIAQISVQGKHIHLGLFREPTLAARAYNDAAKVHFGEFATLNEVA